MEGLDEEPATFVIDDKVNNDINKLAQLYAKSKGFEQYLQTSSLMGTNVKNVFDIAI